MNSASDAQCVQKIKLSDQTAFKELFERYQDAIFNFLRYKLADGNAAEDLLQEVFVRVWNHRHDLDPSRSIKAYLYAIANNLALNHFRHQKVVRTHEKSQDTGMQTSQTPDQIMDHQNLQDALRNAISELPDMMRIVFTMSRFEDLSYRQISERLGIAVKTVETHMGKALKRLRKNLKPYMS